MTKDRRNGDGGREFDRSHVLIVAARLRDDILALPVDSFLGVEDDLLRRYSTSRPTLRQAVRLLEHGALMQVKRGHRGGYYTSRPRQRDAVAGVTSYLQLNNCTVEQAVSAGCVILAGMAHEAARATDEGARRRLADLLAEYEAARVADLPVAEFVKSEVRLAEAIGRLAGNPALTLFSAAIYEFLMAHAGARIFVGRPGRIADRMSYNLAKARAILSGDEPTLDLLAAREQAVVAQWLAEAAAQGRKSRRVRHPVAARRRARPA